MMIDYFFFGLVSTGLILLYLLVSYIGLRFIGPHLISYDIREDRVVIRMFWVFPYHWIRYSNIVDVKEVRKRSFWYLYWSPLASRVFVQSYVVIRARKSWFFPFTPNIAITPKDPATFVRKVKEKINEYEAKVTSTVLGAD